jgi:hypothetical protein
MPAEDYRRWIGQLDEQIGALHRRRRRLQRRFAEHHPVVVLPVARARTPTQQLVARCPRCGGSL